MHKLYELKDMLCDELEEYASKGKLDVGGLEIVDKLSHAIKNLDKIIESYEEEEGYSMEGRGGSYAYAQGGNTGGNMGGNTGRSNRGSYERGRGRNARRDSMGRYSSRRGRYSREGGYSMASEDMVNELREIMQDAPDEQTRMEFERLIQKLEQM